VDWVDSGERALLALAAERFELVVLDIGLPGMDGLELLRRVRECWVSCRWRCLMPSARKRRSRSRWW
jgi:DNA-binding response OmpR family regulator